MDKNELQEYLNQFVQSDELAHFRPSETEGILVTDIPEDVEIEISELDEKGIRHIELEGSFKKQSGKLYLHMAHDWYRKWWTAPLGMAHHMDLIKRLVEFRQKEEKISKRLNSMMKVIGVTYIILLSSLMKLKLYMKHMISVSIFQFGKIGFFIVFKIELVRL